MAPRASLPAMRTPAFLLLVTAALALAGCTGDGGESTDDGADGAGGPPVRELNGNVTVVDNSSTKETAENGGNATTVG